MVAIVIFMHVRVHTEQAAPSLGAARVGPNSVSRTHPDSAFRGSSKLSFKPRSLELSWRVCWWWVIASRSPVVIKDLRLILA